MWKKAAIFAMTAVMAGSAWCADEAQTTVLPATPTPATVAPGGKLTVPYKWEAGTPYDKDYKVFVHIRKEGENKPTLQDDHGLPVKTSSAEWKGTIQYNRTITVPEKATDGNYIIVVGLYDKAGRAALKAGEGVKALGGNSYQVGGFTVKDNRTEILPATITPAEAAPGSTVKIEYAWKASEPLDKDYFAFVHFFKEGEKKIAFQGDHALPVKTSSADWKDTVRDVRNITIPANAAPGKYLVVAGLWTKNAPRPSLKTGEGVKASSGSSYVIGSFTVK
jgi:hypothetical protein